jgi:hypothetical protein
MTHEHTSEMPVAQLDPGRGQTKRTYLFAYRSTGEQPIVVFDHCHSRVGKHAATFLGDWSIGKAMELTAIGQPSGQLRRQETA